ncbi:MAG TPA: outer membrane protein transport protein [Acidiferrobacter sp.]|nr:outer membrane protein transport protein [Acidiferrobacter sp.]
MVSTKKWALASAIAAAMAMPVTALATTAGYFQLGYSSIADGMAGASAALPQDTMIQATNPAGIAFVGNQLDLGIAGFWPFRKYSATNNVASLPSGVFNLQAGTYGSSTNFFLIPHIGYSQRLSHDNYVGIAIYGNGGMSTNYKPSATYNGPFYMGPGTGGQTGVNLSQLFVQATYARKFLRHDSVGLSIIAARQTFSADGLGGFANYSSNSAALTNNGKDTSTGVGFKIGTQFRIVPGVDLGLAYSPRMTMSKFSKYAGLFANQGQFDIPANGVIGLAFKPTSDQVLAFDFQRIYYNDVPSIADPIGSLLTGSKLGSTNGPGFGWQNVSVYKLGYQIATSNTFTWRVGFAYNTQPIPSSQVLFNILAPGVIQRHVTAGVTVHTAPNQNITVAAMYGLNQSVTGPNPMDGGAQSVTLTMHEYQLEANWGWQF